MVGNIHVEKFMVKKFVLVGYKQKYYNAENFYIAASTICDRACENQPCERKLHVVIFL